MPRSRNSARSIKCRRTSRIGWDRCTEHRRRTRCVSLDDNIVLYYTTAVIFLAAFSFINLVINSTFGQVVRAIRDNEMRAVSLGFDVNRYKLLAFTLSAAVAGLAGANKAIAFKLATLVDVHWTTSGNVILMTLLGGLGTLFGPVAGALVFVMLENYLADSGLPVQLVIGAIFILCILLFRRGVIGEIERLVLRRS